MHVPAGDGLCRSGEVLLADNIQTKATAAYACLPMAWIIIQLYQIPSTFDPKAIPCATEMHAFKH